MSNQPALWTPDITRISFPEVQNIALPNDMQPITVAERSEAWTVFARSDAGIVGSNPTEVWMFLYVYAVFVLGSGLAIGWSLIQGVLPTVLD
jgi:hypothetical protein